MPAPIKIQATVNTVIGHGNGVYTVRLSVPSRATRFKAGQFLHLALDPFDPAEGYWPDSRVFSIASKPEGETLEIVYSVKGLFTKRMETELSIGKQVWLKLPYGDFIVEKHIKPGQHVVFIAGGTGISPFIPYFHQVIGQGDETHIAIHYGIRDREHFLYKSVLEDVSSLAEVLVVEGLFDIQAISKELANQRDSVCFISGPPNMIHAFQDELRVQGFPSDSIIIDAWE
nr:hypothetical protein [uncultured Sphaerochaeta sp.]